jgi:hypothetical protein
MAALIEIKQVGGFDARNHTDVESSCPEPFPHFDRVSSRALNPVNCLANTGRILAYSIAWSARSKWDSVAPAV